jgi:hypothetical protein
VNGARDKFHSSSGFAFDESGGIRWRDDSNEIQYPSEGPASSDDVFKAVVHTLLSMA